MPRRGRTLCGRGSRHQRHDPKLHETPRGRVHRQIILETQTLPSGLRPFEPDRRRHFSPRHYPGLSVRVKEAQNLRLAPGIRDDNLVTQVRTKHRREIDDQGKPPRTGLAQGRQGNPTAGPRAHEVSRD